MQKASLSFVVLAVIASGCASQPDAGTAAPAVIPGSTAAATTAPEPRAMPTAAAEAPAAIDPAAVLASNHAGAGEAPSKVPPGYKAVQRGGETVYCKSVTPLGTRFPKQLCMSTAEYEEYERRGVGLREELTRKQISIDAQP